MLKINVYYLPLLLSLVMLLLRQIIHACLIQVGFLQASPLGLGMWYVEVYSYSLT